MAVTARKKTSPAPGQPSGNVEKRRCTDHPVSSLTAVAAKQQPKKRIERTPLSGCLEIDDAALESDGDGVSAVVGAEFGENIFDMALHGLFGDGKLGCDFLVCISA